MNRTHKRQLPLLFLSLHLRVSLQLTSPVKQQRNKQITFSPEHIFAPKFTPRYTPISRTMSPTHVQPFFRAVPTFASVATSMQAAQCHLRVRAFTFPPFPPREFPQVTSYSSPFLLFPKGFSLYLSFSRAYKHTHTRTHTCARTTLAGLAHQVDSLVNGRARFRL